MSKVRNMVKKSGSGKGVKFMAPSDSPADDDDGKKVMTK